MPRLNFSVVVAMACAFGPVELARAQGRGGGEWMTAGRDAQRSSWVRSDPKISVESLAKPGFGLTWKFKLKAEPGMAATVDRYTGYRGFRAYAFMGSTSGELTAFDSDLGRIEWQKKLAGASSGASAACPGGMTANVSRPTAAALSAAVAGPGRGSRGPAKSVVGEPFQGVPGSGPSAGAGAPGGRGGAAPAPYMNPRPVFVTAISSDGMLHSMYISNGEEPAPPVAFLPPNANAQGLVVLDNVAYAATSHNCGGAPNGVWALDIASRHVSHWTPAAGDIAGSAGPAFGGDATVYAATTAGDLVALQPKTLQLKAAYHSGGEAFTASPLVFAYKDRTMVAAPTQDGRLHLVDAATLAGAAYPATASGALASWQDAAGTRWLVAPSKDSIAAWKVIDQGDVPALQAGWTSQAIPSPMAPIVVNGVVFVVSNSPAAVLHALDGATGKELWNSGKTMSAAVRIGSLSGSGGELIVGTTDGTVYAFGFPMEH